jgi:methionyl aminopeptidase
MQSIALFHCFIVFITLNSLQTINGLARGFGSTKSPKFPYTGKLQPSVERPPPLLVPDSIKRPDYAIDGIPKVKKRGNAWDVEPLDPEDIPRMRTAGRIAREVLDEAIRCVKPGITTLAIDEVVHKATIDRNSYPSPLNYHGFPRSCCTSVNEIICHGIPDYTLLNDGDIVNIDVTIFHDGVHGDCSETVFVGTLVYYFSFMTYLSYI